MRLTVILLLLSLPAFAQQYQLNVVYDATNDVYQESVLFSLKESQRNDKLATLCAYYIIHGKLIEAGDACNQAVSLEGTFAAYNNRGVLRAKLGDTRGALEDFDVVRILPENQKMYLNELAKTDTRMIATSNYSVVKRLAKNNPRVEIKGADPEQIQ